MIKPEEIEQIRLDYALRLRLKKYAARLREQADEADKMAKRFTLTSLESHYNLSYKTIIKAVRRRPCWR